MKYMLRWMAAILLLALLIGGMVLMRSNPFSHSHEQIDKEVILERIQEARKLVTTEGHFSEVMDYKSYIGYDWWPFRKKALIRVRAKVLVGYDVDAWNVHIDEERKIVEIRDIGEAQVLAIDHDLDYYDITEGTFNAFTEEDHNRLQAQAKNVILHKAKETGLLRNSEEKIYEYLDFIQSLVSKSGWQLAYPDPPIKA